MLGGTGVHVFLQREHSRGPVFSSGTKPQQRPCSTGAEITRKLSLLSQTPFMLRCCICRTLLQQLQKLQTVVMGKVSGTCKLAGTQTGTCLMVSPQDSTITALPTSNPQSLPTWPRPSAAGLQEPLGSLSHGFWAVVFQRLMDRCSWLALMEGCLSPLTSCALQV